MLKVECESCKAPYQVDERRVPPTGLKMRCPKCGHTFLVTDPSKGAAPAAAGAPRPPPLKKPTMVGVGGFGGPAPGPAASPAPPPVDDGLALPAVRSAAGRPPPIHARPAAPIAGAKPAPPPAAALPGLDDLDLPALVGDVGLPAPAARKATASGRATGTAKAPAFNFEVDLPAVSPAPAPKGGGGFGSVDLPSPKSGGADLPTAKGFGSIDLPTAKGFGAADLPMAKGYGAADLPTAKGFGSIDLPTAKGGFADLPSLQNDLPLVGSSLPMAKGGGFGEIDLPSLQNDLPQAMGAQAHMPVPVSDDRHLPSRAGAAPQVAFGELDLPVVGGSGGSAPPLPQHNAPGGGVSFGELDLPADPSMSAQAPNVGHSSPPAGAMAFGEVDLGGGGESAQVMGPPPATSAGNFAFQEASLETSSQDPSVRHARAAGGAPPVARSSSKVPKIIAGLALVLVVGGSALELIPTVGAFGRLYLGDLLHSGDYLKAATSAGDNARKKLADDTFASSTQAADDLADARKRTPRSRPLSAYAAFVEYANQTRFGGNAERSGRVNTFIADIPPNTPVPYLTAEKAAEAAASGDWEKAKAGLAQAAGVDPKDGIQQDIAILRGEIALAQKDTPTALAAFGEAQKMAPSARAQFGLARAYYLTKNVTKTKEAVDATLALSPNHAGAHTLRALVAFELTRDDAASLKELALVLDGKARKSEGASEVSEALAARGWILLARDRATDARAAFDEAVKVDTRNVSALVGQGEVLYSDGRFAEALTRFEEAVKRDPTSVPAILGDAKTKISLERLQDAKTQLTAARAKFPKDMSIALWLAKTEESLGDKAAAEKLYSSAVDLADPQNPGAIEAYAAFASFLASQGRTPEAQAKLDQARAKLPDSGPLQRAFGEVAAAQGLFDEAVSHFQAALEKTPTDLGTRFRLGVTYRRMRKLDLATQELDKVAAIDKEYPGIALERGLLFEESGDVQKALEQFQTAQQKAPKDIDLQLRIGAAYVAIGEVDKALPMLNAVKDARPNSAEANHFIGRAYLKSGGLESAAAMRYLQRAVELDPNRAEYHLYVAWAANEASPAQLGLARTEVEKALSLDKLLADGYWQRGVTERREGAVNDAVKDLKRALELKPGRQEAHATLAECYEDKNDTAGAMAEWAKAIAGDDKQATWRYRYGRLLLEKNQTAEAAKHLAYAVSVGKSAQPRPGWLGPAAFEAGEALRKTGQKHDSAEAYRLYLELSPPTAPDRRDAIRGLTADGEPYDPPH